MLKNLSENNSILGMYLRELRDSRLQTDRMRFRNNLRRVGQLMALEISKTLEYVPEQVQTCLGVATCSVLKEQPIVGTVLRAGLPMHEGFLDVFDRADNAFIGAYRREEPGSSVSVALDYVGTAPLAGRTLLFCDPMLATAGSMLSSLTAVEKHGIPKQIHVAAIFASAPGIQTFQRARPDAHLWVAAIDPELNSKAYIVPGLGDAGNLAYGEKL